KRTSSFRAVVFLAIAVLATSIDSAWCAPSNMNMESDPGPPGWLPRVIEHIRESEYGFSPIEDGHFSAPNRAHDLRTSVAAAGVDIVSRAVGSDGEPKGWKLHLRLSAWGRKGILRT